MIATVKGKVKNNTVVFDRDFFGDADGVEVVVIYSSEDLASGTRERKQNKTRKVSFTTEGVDAWISENGQPEMLIGEVGLESMRELTKNDVW